ncbi:hypothetical protein ACFSCX_16560 [Bacillus salitolerans]|uniref:Lipoprotein n=1 Tax=Bacillus salitolerans TaxID=1437434 RepID=A0ABW4LTG1_9BACI
MKKLALLLICITFITACSSQDQTSTELCGYGPMMVVNGKDYLKIPVKKSFNLEQKLGVIKEKLDEMYHPEQNFSSNSLEVGSTIYSVKGYEQYLIAKTVDNKYYLFEEIY